MKNIFYFSTTLSLLLFILFTGSGEYAFYINNRLERSVDVVGFPFIWLMDGVNSLEVDIAIIPLLLNLLIYFMSCSLVLFPFSTFLKKISERSKAIKIAFFIVSFIAILSWFLLMSVNEIYFVSSFPTEGYEMILNNYHLSFYALIN
ncbi:hypothetical protein [Psychromonas algicola]|uniref:hypothetical protein n=1 Tax=Psychromonas algicola TaxID=2555642 RepID=UPI0010684206|nr:hypothetical protein [Psychromonas sp. RZ5]TEW50154.1 hypothetical protein E2R67_09825 [Psychromonas sp. RZ5]